MSTQPENWQTPKTNWSPQDPIGASDLNRWEGNTSAIETGDRTLDQAQAPSSHVGSLRQILDWFANRIKAITGTTNWYDAPATTLAAAKSHMDASLTSGSVHGVGAGAAGMFYFANRSPYTGASFARYTSNLENGWISYTVGPTGSDASIVWTELNKVPSSAKAIRLNLRAMLGHGSDAQQGTELVLGIGTTANSYGDALALRADLSMEYAKAANTVDVVLDEQRKFYIVSQLQAGPNRVVNFEIFLAGWYQ